MIRNFQNIYSMDLNYSSGRIIVHTMFFFFTTRQSARKGELLFTNNLLLTNPQLYLYNAWWCTVYLDDNNCLCGFQSDIKMSGCRPYRHPHYTNSSDTLYSARRKVPCSSAHTCGWFHHNYDHVMTHTLNSLVTFQPSEISPVATGSEWSETVCLWNLN